MAAIVSPQLPAMGEPNPNRSEHIPNNKIQQTYASQLLTNNSASISTKLVLKPVQIVHGEPTIQFTMEERQTFAVEEGLHQAVVLKLSPRAPDLQVLRSLLPKILSIKGHCLIGHLAPRQLLLRLDQPEDFVNALARAVNSFSHSGEQHQYRVFPWTVGYNPKEETSKAAVWISLPNLSPELFARQSLLSIANAVGKPIAIDKATQVKSRPSTARVKVILDLLDKLPTRIRLQYVDNASGKIVEVFQEVIYDNLPGYCIYCKRQGHIEEMCRLLLKNKIDDAENLVDDMSSVDKLKRDARDFLNAKRSGQSVDDVAKEVGNCNVTETANGELNKANAGQQKSAEGISDDNRTGSKVVNGQANVMETVTGALQDATDHEKQIVNVEAKFPNAQAEREQGFEQGTLAQGTAVAPVKPVDKAAIECVEGFGQFRTASKSPSVTGQVNTQQKQSNVPQVSGPKDAVDRGEVSA
ncbi:uncharacterized protein LOC107806652 [Nicotiana tabacum]|uniref:Uncharacterized protein LOC107806652 n=16 Tax=Nicotiana tabacum TaxID=4097 RepID=A0AC58SVY4_TOBAC